MTQFNFVTAGGITTARTSITSSFMQSAPKAALTSTWPAAPTSRSLRALTNRPADQNYDKKAVVFHI